MPQSKLNKNQCWANSKYLLLSKPNQNQNAVHFFFFSISLVANKLRNTGLNIVLKERARDKISRYTKIQHSWARNISHCWPNSKYFLLIIRIRIKILISSKNMKFGISGQGIFLIVDHSKYFMLLRKIKMLLSLFLLQYIGGQ